jgi:hypothetical protein
MSCQVFLSKYATLLGKPVLVELSGNFVGMDAGESYRDVFMRFPESSASTGSERIPLTGLNFIPKFPKSLNYKTSVNASQPALYPSKPAICQSFLVKPSHKT